MYLHHGRDSSGKKMASLPPSLSINSIKIIDLTVFLDAYQDCNLIVPF